MLLFNPQYGYLEGMVRGFKNGLLNQTEYQALTQCDSLEDLKIHLAVSFRHRCIFEFFLNRLFLLNYLIFNGKLRFELLG